MSVSCKSEGAEEEEEQKTEAITVFVRDLDCKMTVLNLGNTEELQKMTVLQLKEMLFKKETVPDRQRLLIFNGWKMEDFEFLSKYEVHDGCVIHLVPRIRGGGETRRSIENLADFLDTQAFKP